MFAPGSETRTGLGGPEKHLIAAVGWAGRLHVFHRIAHAGDAGLRVSGNAIEVAGVGGWNFTEPARGSWSLCSATLARVGTNFTEPARGGYSLCIVILARVGTPRLQLEGLA